MHKYIFSFGSCLFLCACLELCNLVDVDCWSMNRKKYYIALRMKVLDMMDVKFGSFSGICVSHFIVIK